MMFNDLKIDKLKLLYKKKDVAYEQRTEIKNWLEYYFPDCTTSCQSGFIQHNITPTKIIRPKTTTKIHNLQMPSEKELLNALEDATLHNSQVQDELKSTLIHLTKDIILQKPVKEYISMLSEIPYSNLDVELKSSNSEPSLYLHHNYSVDSQESCKFLIKFYNKVQQFYKEHGHYKCQLYKPLTPKEIELVGNAYIPKKKILNLEHLNILRIEIEYHETAKIKPIIKELNPSADCLSLSIILNALKNKNFYSTLDKVFNTTLQKYVFSANTKLKTATAELSKVRQLACKLYHESGLTCHYTAVANELGLSNQISEINSILRKIMPDSDLYTELHNILFSSDDKLESTEEEQRICDCNPCNFRTLKDILLIYDVPIWDDS